LIDPNIRSLDKKSCRKNNWKINKWYSTL